jgi:capsular exopolysaccharide synthesis family protein
MAIPAQETPPSAEAPGLVRALRVLQERWWMVIICPAIAFLVALVYLERQPVQYTATSKLQFSTNSLPSQVAGVSNNQPLDPEGVKATDLQLVTTLPVATLVVKTLRLDIAPAALLEEVNATNPQNDYIVDISVTNQSPTLAASIANAFAQQYVVYSETQNVEQLVKGERLITRKEERLSPEDTTDRANLHSLYQKLLLLQAVQTANAQVVDTATVPGSPSAPKKKATAAIALVVGVLLGVGLAFLLNLIDRRIRSWEAFEELYGVPALASIPQLPQHRPQTAAEAELALEPFRILHNSLSLLPQTHPIKTVLVTSAVPGEGKTSVAIGLARVAALSDRQVILVEADLRRPSMERRLHVERGAHGLATALHDGEDPLDLLQTPIDGLENLKMLPTGSVPLNATLLLSSDELSNVFDRLASHADLIVVDSAPLLPVADTRVLLDELNLDACLVVARAGVTTRDQVRRARLIFDRRKMQSVGLVVNSLTEAGDRYQYYGMDEADDWGPLDEGGLGSSRAAGGSLRNTESTSATVITRSASKNGK